MVTALGLGKQECKAALKSENVGAYIKGIGDSALCSRKGSNWNESGLPMWQNVRVHGQIRFEARPKDHRSLLCCAKVSGCYSVFFLHVLQFLPIGIT